MIAVKRVGRSCRANRVSILVSVVAVLAGLPCWMAAGAAPSVLVPSISPPVEADQIVIDLDVPEVAIERGPKRTATFHCRDAQWLNETGQPNVPWQIVHVLLPPDAALDTVSVSLTGAEFEPVEGRWTVEPTPPPATWVDGKQVIAWPEDRKLVDGYDVEAYAQDALWPTIDARLVHTGRLRKWRLAHIAIPLIKYNPVRGLLETFSAGQVVVRFKRAFLRIDDPQLQMELLDSVGLDRVGRIAVNFDQQRSAYEKARKAASKKRSADVREGVTGKVLLNDPNLGKRGYVIITDSSTASACDTLDDFVAHKESLGFDVQVITESDFGGGVGPVAAENIRNWLYNNYLTENLLYVLLIGNPDAANGTIPMKFLRPCFVEDVWRSASSDFYYADLVGSSGAKSNWDLDNDNQYGEWPDDFGYGGVDRDWEVLVGRIPYYGDPGEMYYLNSMLAKMIAYQQEGISDAEWRVSTLLPMKPCDEDTPSYQLGENIKDDILAPHGCPYHRAYDDDYGLPDPPETIPCTSIIDILENVPCLWQWPDPPPNPPDEPGDPNGHGPFGLVVWLSHGLWDRASDIINKYQVTMYLNDEVPAFVFQASCLNADPARSGNLAHTLLKNGAICTVAATSSIYYRSGQTQYAGKTCAGGLGYAYSERVVGGATAGLALADLRAELVPTAGTWWRNFVALNLHGDPHTYLLPPVYNATQEKWYCTIQGAIDGAGYGDQIVASPGIYTETIDFDGKCIVLRSEDPNDPNVVWGTMIYAGENGSAVTFAGTEDPNAVLEGFTITNGLTAGSGGGISGNGTEATIRKCVITGNEAAHGAGLHACDGIVADCTIEGNTASSSGGGLGNCDGDISGCTIADNSAGQYGGGLAYCDGSISNCTISGNTAGASGGGMEDCDATISNCMIMGNAGGSVGGGGMHHQGGTVTVRNCTFSSNSAAGDGGAVYGEYGGDLDFANCIFWNDTATDGAEIYVTADASATVSYSDIDPNDACADPNDPNAEVTWGSGNIQADPLFVDPNGNDYHLQPESLCVNAGDPNYQPAQGETDIDGDNRVLFGRLDMGADEVTDDSGLPAWNITQDIGYHIIQDAIDEAVDYDQIEVDPGTYYENVDFDGVNVHLRSTDPNDPDVVAATVIDGNDAGSVVTFAGTEDPNAVLEGFTVTNGWTASNGGGISGNETEATIRKCVISDNEAGYGAGVHGCDGAISRCIIRDNTATTQGGGLDNCDADIDNCMIVDNATNGSGGGSSWDDGSSPEVTNCTIAGNSAAGQAGGTGVYCNSSSTSPTLTNCIVWGNTDPNDPNAAQIVLAGGATITVAYSDVEGGYTGTGNIDSDPLFADSTDSDYHLLLDSPCVDAGDPNGVYTGQEDIDGHPREWDGDNDDDPVVDMGADEKHVIHVCWDGSEDYQTIGAALAASSAYDEIIVCDGTYTGSGNYNLGVSVGPMLIRSVNGPDDCVIDPNGSERAFGLSADDITIAGFTIRNGYGSLHGGAICCTSDAAIDNCKFIDNTAVAFGGAIYVIGDVTITVSGCEFAGNVGGGSGAGVWAGNGALATFDNSVFTGNEGGSLGGALGATGEVVMRNCSVTDNSALVGAGAFLGDGGSIVNCTFSNNSAASQGGGVLSGGDSLEVTNCIFWDNTATTYAPEIVKGGGAVTVSYCLVEDGQDGVELLSGATLTWEANNLDPNDPPVFVDPNNSDYHVDPNSPCIDVGDPNGAYTGQADMDGQARVFDGDGQNGPRVDMGADEYVTPTLDPNDGDPTADGTLPKTQNNVILLVFDDALVLPTGNPVSIRVLGDPNAPDLAGDFEFSLATTNMANDTLKCVEDGEVLIDDPNDPNSYEPTWYRLEPTGDFWVVDFDLDVCTLRGDANNSDRVTTADYSPILAHLGEETDARYDLDGNGIVQTADYDVVKDYMGDRAPSKP